MGRFVAPALVAAAGLALLAGTANADTVLGVWNLNDHPDGNANPPPYGLRFDNAFAYSGGDGGVTTFSFDHFNNTTMTVTELNDSSLRVNIVGTLYGGEKNSGFGTGAYDLNMVYNLGVQADGTGYVADTPSGSNHGTLTAQVGTPFWAGDTLEFSDKANGSGLTFAFLQDGHRLSSAEKAGFGGNPHVGRGWVMRDNYGGTHDFLFVATERGGQIIPLPGAAGMGFAGLAGLTTVRRRR